MPGSSKFQIRIVGPEGARVELLEKPDMVLGRSAQADIIISNSEVSRRHAVLMREGDKLFVVDEGSKNGTFVDDKRVAAHTPHGLRVGQVLRLGLAPQTIHIENSVVEARALEMDLPPQVPQESVRGSLPAIQAPQIERPGAAKIDPLPIPVVNPLRVDADEGPPDVSLSRSMIAEPLLRANARAPSLPAQPAAVDVSKQESQLREIEIEIKSRLEERRLLSRELADYKLKVQALEQESQHLAKARDQLGAALAKEVGDLEVRHLQLSEALAKEGEVERQRLQKEIRELHEKAKKQAEMLLLDAEVKAKAVREKAQFEAADAHKAIELEVADFRLKQMQELKAQQEKEEGKWTARKEKLAAQLAQEAVEFSSRVARECGLSALDHEKVERILRQRLQHRFGSHHSDSGDHAHDEPGTISNVAVSPRATSGPHHSVGQPRPAPVHEAEPISFDEITQGGPPPVPRWTRMGRVFSVAMVLAVIVLGYLALPRLLEDSDKKPQARQTASLPKPAAPALAEPGSAELTATVSPSPSPAVPTTPSASAAVPVAPPEASGAAKPVVGASAAPPGAVPADPPPPVIQPQAPPTQAPAPPPTQVQIPAPAPKAAPVTRLPAKEPSAPAVVRLADGFQAKTWETNARRFLHSDLRLQEAVIRTVMAKDAVLRVEYQRLETKRLTSRERALAISAAEGRYAKELTRLLGGVANWRKFNAFRQKYASKIR